MQARGGHNPAGCRVEEGEYMYKLSINGFCHYTGRTQIECIKKALADGWNVCSWVLRRVK